MSPDKWVFVVCCVAGAFLAGMEAGYEKSAVALAPCPQENGKEVAYRTKDVCTYVTHTKTRAKWERKV